MPAPTTQELADIKILKGLMGEILKEAEAFGSGFVHAARGSSEEKTMHSKYVELIAKADAIDRLIGNREIDLHEAETEASGECGTGCGCGDCLIEQRAPYTNLGVMEKWGGCVIAGSDGNPRYVAARGDTTMVVSDADALVEFLNRHSARKATT